MAISKGKAVSGIIMSLFLLMLEIPAKGQFIIINDNFKSRMSEIKANVVDSLTNEPVQFASVYLIPAKDTNITNFTLTDTQGNAKIEEVPFGRYTFHVEMLGFKPYKNDVYLREPKVDFGTIRMKQDEFFIQAATVTDVGNPIVIKKDTVEFNASSFSVGANAMLKDLIQRMPGMEITENGKVRFNGEEIDKLTVGGRTFFFDDQSTALNNLPASIVDKVRVIDRQSEQTRASGIEDGRREKVLDVALKKEYEKGWFGNVGLNGGTTLGGKQSESPLRDDRGLLYSGNALVSAYNEKDQLTVIANGQNVNLSNAIIMVIDETGNRSNANQGLSTAAQVGVNANSMRIKDVETTAAVNYKYTDTKSANKVERTTHLDSGDLVSQTDNEGRYQYNTMNANLEFKKEKGKLWFHIEPSFRYTTSEFKEISNSATYRSDSFVNSSGSDIRESNLRKYALLNSDFTFRDVGGKKGRSIRLAGYASIGAESGDSDESSLLTVGNVSESREMNFISRGKANSFNGSVRYTEPLGKKVTLSSSASIEFSDEDLTRDAFDGHGRNDFYSSANNTNGIVQQYSLTSQYKFTASNWITLGGTYMGVLNEVRSKSYGIEETIGENEWIWSFTPTIRASFSKNDDRFQASLYGYNINPNTSLMRPVMNISDPSRPGLGNIYLKPSTQSYFYTTWTRNDKKRFSTLMLYLSGSFTTHPTSYAQWYDAGGILYSIPVNAVKPSMNASANFNYTTPLDKKKLFSLNLSSTFSYTLSNSYQTRSTLPGLDKDNFDYSAFMADFWGDETGDRFYGGQSGFIESRTGYLRPYASATLKYNNQYLSYSLGANVQGNIARYSVNPDFNRNTLDTRFTSRATYKTKSEFEFGTDLTYAFYNGYPEGYGLPEWRWNAEVSKNIGAFNLSLKVHDILNQTRNLTHTVNANYEENSYRLILGRYILVGVKWNFGKMNASHSMKAQRAAMGMVW